jgi:hypothetical protein
MLELDQDLPQSVLLQNSREDFAAKMNESGALWMNSDRGSFDVDPKSGVISGWRSANGEKTAIPTQPNDGHGHLAALDGRSGLRCMSEVHCGLVVPRVTEVASTFTMAVIYKPSEDQQSKTLLTLNTGYTGGAEQDANYLFLSDGGDFFTVKDVQGTVEITAPVLTRADQMRMAVVTLTGDVLALSENLNAPTVSEGANAGMRTAADLFIGCRSHRGGLKKTLGGATIFDVMFWPKHALLAPRTQEDEAAFTNLKRYFLWEY